MKKMHDKGIETGSHYIPAHLMSFYKKNHILPITEKVAKEVVTLPMHPNLTNKEIEFIIKTANSLIQCILKIIRNAKKFKKLHSSDSGQNGF